MRLKDARPNDLRPTQVWIYIGAALFLLALFLSAILVPDQRILHSLQALIYVAVIVLARRNSAWGYGVGFSIAILWNAMGLFITHLIQAGVISFWLLLYGTRGASCTNDSGARRNRAFHFDLRHNSGGIPSQCRESEGVEVRRRRVLRSVLRSPCRFI